MMIVVGLAVAFYLGHLLLIIPDGMNEQEYRAYFKRNILGMK